jgi:hypothetical protein
MAQVAIKSVAVTNYNAIPRVQNLPGLGDGRVVRAVNGLCTLTSGDTQAVTLAAGASTYRFGKIKSSDFYDQLRIVTTADAGTTTVVDVGLYDLLTAANGGTVVDQDFFASSLSLKDSAIVTTGSGVNAADQTFEAGAAGGLITNAEKRIWECLGLSADPSKEYDVAMTLTGACDGTATALLQVYVVRSA